MLFRGSRTALLCTIDVCQDGFLIHLNARVVPVGQNLQKLKEMPVTVSTMLVIIGVLIFAAFAGSLAWAQLYSRHASIAPVQGARPKRRAF